jgi:D-sorbitol dehydrogenase (acceptor)
MPAFATELNNAQIASVTRYVRSHFAGINDELTADEVAQLRQGGQAPLIVRYMNWLIAGGVVLVLLLLFALLRLRRR